MNYSTPNKPQKEKKAKRPRLNALTLVTLIATDSVWSQSIRYNEFSGKVLVSAEFPPMGREPTEGYREFDEQQDVLMATLLFQGTGFPNANRSVVRDAILATAFQNRFHPVRDYLNSLKWDGTKRIHKLAQNYFSVPIILGVDNHEQYLQATSKCWMIAAVARVMRPGCKVDNLPVLAGPEDLMKSEGVRELCPNPDWFSEDLSTELGERDTKESLVGKWIIELSEIPHARREADRVKAFFSRRTDRYRKAYGTANADHPRQNVFVGTSNDLELTSNTGNRRFWPWDVDARVKVEDIRQDRNQLWAEAVHLFNQGSEWWLAKAISDIATEVQAEFTDGDELWFQQIDAWVDGRTEGFLLETLFVGALGYDSPPIIDRKDQMRAGAVLKSLGYRRRRQRLQGIRGYWWQKPAGRDKAGRDTPPKSGER